MRRRALLAGLGLLALAAASRARAQSPLDGTWGGARGELTAQVIMTGGAVIGFYWRGDYVDADEVRLSPGGDSVAFTFKGGRARLTRTGEGTAMLEVDEGARLTRLKVRRD